MARRVFMGVVALLLATPVVVLAGVAMNAERILLFPPDGLSLRWWAEVWTDDGWRGAMATSVSIAAASAALAVAVAAPLAWVAWAREWRIGRVVAAIGLAPFVLPPVITALGALSFWATVGFYGQPAAVVITHAIFFVTLPLVTLSLGFAAVDRELIEAARTMGADERAVTRTVVWPLVRPYAVSGYAFAFVLSLNEYIVAYMVAGFTVETLPIKIFNSLRYGYTPTMAAVSVLFVLVAAVVFGLIARFGDLPKLLGAWGRG